MTDDLNRTIEERLDAMNDLLYKPPSEEHLEECLATVEGWYTVVGEEDPQEDSYLLKRGDPPQEVCNALYTLDSAGTLKLYNVINVESHHSRGGGVVYTWPMNFKAATRLAELHHEETGLETIVRQRGGGKILRRFKAAKPPVEIEVVEDSAGLPDNLAELINQEHRAAQHSYADALGHAMRAGAMLAAQKDNLKHGEFLGWVKANCEFSDRTANDYMRLHRHHEEIEANSQRAADMSIRGALKAIAPPPKPKKQETAEEREERKRHSLEEDIASVRADLSPENQGVLDAMHTDRRQEERQGGKRPSSRPVRERRSGEQCLPVLIVPACRAR